MSHVHVHVHVALAKKLQYSKYLYLSEKKNAVNTQK